MVFAIFSNTCKSATKQIKEELENNSDHSITSTFFFSKAFSFSSSSVFCNEDKMHTKS